MLKQSLFCGILLIGAYFLGKSQITKSKLQFISQKLKDRRGKEQHLILKNLPDGALIHKQASIKEDDGSFKYFEIAEAE